MMTATSLLNKIEEERRGALYYGKHQYRISFDLTGAGRTYYCDDISDLDTRMTNNGETYAAKNMDRTLLAMFIHWRGSHIQRRVTNHNLTITPNANGVRVYTSDLAILSEIAHLGFDNIKVTKALADIPMGIMEFAREPKHKYRTYFKSKRVDDEFRSTIADFLQQYTDIHPCYALNRWVKMPGIRWASKWLSSSFFVEYDTESMKSVMMLLLGNKYVGKHYELVKRK